MFRKIVITAAVAAVLPLAGCSAYDASHNHNAPTPVKDIRGGWTRIDTPGNFPSVVWRCIGHDGVYVTMDNSSSVEVETSDPNCP